jgi:hypothetical protein
MNQIDSILKAFSKTDLTKTTPFENYLKKLSEYNGVIDTTDRRLTILPHCEKMEIEVDTFGLTIFIENLVNLLENVLENVLENGDYQVAPEQYAILNYIFKADYIDRLRNLDSEFYKTLYILIKLFRFIYPGHIPSRPLLSRILGIFSLLYHKNPDFELTGPLSLIEKSVLEDSTWKLTLFHYSEYKEDKNCESFGATSLLFDLLLIFANDSLKSLLVMNMLGHFISHDPLHIPKGLDEVLIVQIQNKSSIYNQIIALNIYHMIENSKKAFLFYPFILQRISKDDVVYGISDSSYFFGEQDTVVKDCLEYVAEVNLNSCNADAWKGIMYCLVLHLIRQHDSLIQNIIFILFSSEWESIPQDCSLLLLFFLKSNLNHSLSHVSRNEPLIKWVLFHYFSNQAIQDPLYNCFLMIKNQQLGSNLMILEYCLDNRALWKWDNPRVLFVLSESIESINYIDPIPERLFDIAKSLSTSRDTDLKHLCRYLNGLVTNEGLAMLLVDFLFSNLPNENIKLLLRYILVHTKWEKLFGVLVDHFIKVVEEHLCNNRSVDHFVGYLTEIFFGTLVNEFLVDLMIRFDFIGIMVRLVLKIEYQQGSLFLSFINLIGKILSYDYKFAEEFVNVDGYFITFEAYTIRKQLIGIDCFATPLLFVWQGNHFNILHPASIEFLFEIINTIEPDPFLEIFSLFLANCTSSNLWNMEQCRIANAFQKILGSLEYFDHYNMLEKCSDLIIAQLSYHSDFQDVRLLMGLLAKTTIGSHKISIQAWTLKIMEKVSHCDRSRIPNDYFMLNGPDSKIEVPMFSRALLNSKGYSFLLWFKLTALEFSIFEIEWADVNYFLSFSIKDGNILLLLKEDTLEKVIRLKDCKLELGRWYSIMYSHKVGIFNISSDCVYLDRQMVWKGNLWKSQLRSSIQIEIARQKRNIYPIYISSFAFFNQVVSPEIIQLLHFSNENSIPVSPELYQFQLLSANQQPLLFCHPMASFENEFSYNLSSNADIPPHIKLRRIVAVNTRPFADALQSLGSVEIFYPLLSTPNQECRLGTTTVIENSAPNRNIVHVVRLLAALIHNSHFHGSNFIRSKGPKLLSLLLQQIPVHHVNIELFNSLIYLRNISTGFSGLAEMIDEHLIYEPQIWSRCEQPIRREYFSKLLVLADDTKNHDLTHWMDSFEQFYGGICKESGSWDFIQKLLSYSPTDTEITRFCESLWCCIYSPEAPILYDFFEDMYIVNKTFYEAVLDFGGVELILRMCQSAHESVRCHALRICVRILTDTQIFTHNMEDEVSRLGESVWLEVLGPFEITNSVYVYFLCMLLGKMVVEPLNILGETSELDLKYPLFLKVCLELIIVTVCSDSILKRLSEDLVYLVTYSFEIKSQMKVLGLPEMLLRLIRQKLLPLNEHLKEFEHLAFVIVETFFHSENFTLVNSAAVIELVSLIMYTIPAESTPTVLVSIFNTLLTRLRLTLEQEPFGDSQLRFYETLVVIEELLFYNKDITSFFQEEFGDLLGDFNLTNSRSKGKTNS